VGLALLLCWTIAACMRCLLRKRTPVQVTEVATHTPRSIAEIDIMSQSQADTASLVDAFIPPSVDATIPPSALHAELIGWLGRACADREMSRTCGAAMLFTLCWLGKPPCKSKVSKLSMVVSPYSLMSSILARHSHPGQTRWLGVAVTVRTPESWHVLTECVEAAEQGSLLIRPNGFLHAALNFSVNEDPPTWQAIAAENPGLLAIACERQKSDDEGNGYRIAVYHGTAVWRTPLLSTLDSAQAYVTAARLATNRSMARASKDKIPLLRLQRPPQIGTKIYKLATSDSE